MKKLSLLALLVASTTLVACVSTPSNDSSAQTATPAKTTEQSSTPSAPLSAETAKILDLVNQTRATARTCGTQHFPAAGPLKWNQHLETAAKLHSEDMASQNYFSHESKDGRNMQQRMKNAGYKGKGYFAENIAVGNEGIEATIEQWLKSPGHCANLMSATYVDVGVAHAYAENSEYKHYWTMKLAK